MAVPVDARAPVGIARAGAEVVDGGTPALELVPLEAELVHRLAGKLDEARLDIDLRHGLVNRLDDGLAVRQRPLVRRHDDRVCALERRGDALDELAVLALRAVGIVEELGQLVHGGVVQLERPREDRLGQLVLLHEMDATGGLHAEPARIEDRLHALQPRHVLQRHGDALMEVGGLRVDDVRAGGAAELAQDVRERRVVGRDIDKRRLIAREKAGGDRRTRLRRRRRLGRRFSVCRRLFRRHGRDGGLRRKLDQGAALRRHGGIVHLVQVDLVRILLDRRRRFFLHGLRGDSWLFLHRLRGGSRLRLLSLLLRLLHGRNRFFFLHDLRFGLRLFGLRDRFLGNGYRRRLHWLGANIGFHIWLRRLGSGHFHLLFRRLGNGCLRRHLFDRCGLFFLYDLVLPRNGFRRLRRGRLFRRLRSHGLGHLRGGRC